MNAPENENPRLAALIQAITEDNGEAVNQWILGETFTLIALADDEEDEGALSALVVETEEFPAVVAFLSIEDADAFLETIKDQMDEQDVVELFEVDGEALMGPMSEEFGLVINPESDDSVIIDPSLLHLGSDEGTEHDHESEQDETI